MPVFGLRAPIAAALSLTFAGLVVAPVAHADAGPASPTDVELAGAAQHAADAADLAFTEAHWVDVLTHADAFDEAFGALVDRRDTAMAALAVAQGSSDAAQSELDSAKDSRKAARKARNQATSASEAAVASVNDARKARNKAKTATDEAVIALQEAEHSLTLADGDVVTAQEVLGAAQEDAGLAEEAFNASIASVIGAPSWWTAINDRPTTVAQLFGAYTGTAADVEAKRPEYDAARAEIATAQEALDTASGFRRFGAALALGAVQVKHAGLLAEFAVLEARRDAIDRALTEVGGHVRNQALDDANLAADAAQGALGSALTAQQTASDAVNAAQTDLETKRGEQGVKAQGLTDAKAASLAAAEDQVIKIQALEDAKAQVKAKRRAFNALAPELDAARALFDPLDALVNGLAAAQQSVADRRADLTDLQTVMAQTKVALPADTGEVKMGDSIELAFSVTNSQLFDLSDTTVSMTAPNGVTPACDIPADGIVPAGSVVNCTANYTVTYLDTVAEEITVTVVLAGYIPLGPGNPRARAVNRTLVEVTHTVSIRVAVHAPVVPASVVPAPLVVEPDVPEAADPTPAAVQVQVVAADAVVQDASEELSETGTDAFGSVIDAAAFLLLGLGLVVVSRRRFLGQR